MPDPMQEIMASFFTECEELLEALVDALQTMADGADDSETINVAFRAVHSIKGGAGAFGLEGLVGFAHQLETVMDLCRSGQLATDAALLAVFFRCSDMLSDLVRAARDGAEANSEHCTALVVELAAYGGNDTDIHEPEAEIHFAPMAMDFDDLPSIGSPSPGANDTGQLVVTFQPTPDLYQSGNDPRSLLKSVAALGSCHIAIDCAPAADLPVVATLGSRLSWTIVFEDEVSPDAVREVFEFVEDLCTLEIGLCPNSVALPEPPTSPDEAVSPASPAPPEETPKSAPKPLATVRVDIERIDRLVNLVGELVINQAMLSQSISALNVPPNSPVLVGLEEFLQLTRDIQESVMMIRAQPVKSLFQRMSRIVREASAAIDKPVKLITSGENTEIDKTAIERLADPLTHMIRNAVDHGLEDPAARRAAGKQEQGEISLSAAHRSGRVLIEISDNGGGIDRRKVLHKAIEKGLVPPDATLSDAEIDQLLFLPGFSTADQISNLSGRGVGMDVVKTQITALGGRISIESTPGVGSTFSISLPLTLAVLDGMVVSVAGETLVVPLGAIVETLSLTADDLALVSPQHHVVRVRDRFVPVLDLGTELGYRLPNPSGEKGIALLISLEDGTLVALLVDTIDDQRQVVIKGLQESYGHVPGIAAATILGDGQIALILDPSDLVHSAHVPTLGPDANRKAS